MFLFPQKAINWLDTVNILVNKNNLVGEFSMCIAGEIHVKLL